jgi:membrane protein
MKTFIRHALVALKESTSQEGRIFRYSLSYCFLLALFPSLIIVVMMFQKEVTTYILDLVYQFLPQTLIEPFIEYIVNKEYQTRISGLVALLVPCYMASNCFYSFMLISASEENFKTYSILIRFKSIFVFSLFIITIIALGVIMKYSNIHHSWIAAIGLFVVLYLFYRMLSFAKRCVWYGIPGAICSSITILLVGSLFFEMIRCFTSYQNVYGPLASVATALLAIYLIASIIYFGYCLNNAYDRECQISGYKGMWFFNKGNTVLEKVENKIHLFKKT